MNKVVIYLRQRTRLLNKSMITIQACFFYKNEKQSESNFFQAIVISHRGHIYDKVDVLIGISKNLQKKISQSFIIDLQFVR